MRKWGAKAVKLFAQSVFLINFRARIECRCSNFRGSAFDHNGAIMCCEVCVCMHMYIYMRCNTHIHTQFVYVHLCKIWCLLQPWKTGDDTLPFMKPSSVTLITCPITIHWHLTFAVVLFSLILFSIKMLPLPRDSCLKYLPIAESSFPVDIVFCATGYPLKGHRVGALFYSLLRLTCVFHCQSHKEKDRFSISIDFSF